MWCLLLHEAIFLLINYLGSPFAIQAAFLTYFVQQLPPLLHSAKPPLASLLKKHSVLTIDHSISDLTLAIQRIVQVCKIQKNPEETFLPGWKWAGFNILGLRRISVDEKYICVQKNSKANYTASI